MVCRGRKSSGFILVMGLLLALAAQMLLASCAERKEPAKSRAPVPVKVAMAVRKSVPVRIRAIGNVEAYASVSVRSQVTGMLEQVHFKEGADVRKGQLLFSIDRRPYEAAVRRAKAVLARDAAQERFASVQTGRYAELLKEGIVTRDQHDQLAANAESLAESVRAGRASLDDALLQLGYCSIRSPISGRTGNLVVQRGNLVKANDSQALVSINQVSPVYVTFSVAEKELAAIRKYAASGTLKVEAFLTETGQREKGVLSFIDNSVDAQTGTIRIKGEFANRDRNLWPGQFVTVFLTLKTISDAVVVPSRAVQTGQSGLYVFVVKPGGGLDMRTVTTGGIHDGDTIISKGLAPGETVVTDGHLQLSPDSVVSVKREIVNGKAADR
ncbi:MAG: efflux RND transporter periplasmic adaptor subunit [Geobacteraceae bacterium]|nr:efflux RND transporter periplasmic adaptor subunit [Geobacteraceae bacterium]